MNITTLNIRDLFESALNEYEVRTGTKLPEHEIATRLISCDCADAIIEVLQAQAQKFRKFRGDDGKVMKWIKRTVQVLYTLSSSGALGQGLVCLKSPESTLPEPNHDFVALSSRASDLRWNRRATRRVYLFGLLAWVALISMSTRQSKMLARVTMHWSTFLNPWKTFSVASTSIPRFHLPWL